MATQELLQEIQDFQSHYIENISHWDLFDSFWNNTYDEYSGDDAWLSFKSDASQIWKLVESGFQASYESFKAELFVKYPDLALTGWDGTLSFYTGVWNKHANELFRRAGDPEFVNLGESPDGGSYFFSIDGYTEENTVQFVKADTGEVTMQYSPFWNESTNDVSY